MVDGPGRASRKKLTLNVTLPPWLRPSKPIDRALLARLGHCVAWGLRWASARLKRWIANSTRTRAKLSFRLAVCCRLPFV